MPINKNNILEKELETHCWLHSYQMDNINKNDFMPHILCKGDGVYVYDQYGKQYIDAISGAYCVNVGYGRKRILEASFKAAQEIHFVSPFSAASVPLINLSKRLAELSRPIVGENSRVYFVNSGSEAIDAAMKIARAYSHRNNKPNGFKIICRDNSYHGSTFGALSCCGIEAIKKEYEPLVPGIYHVPNTICIRCPLGLNRQTCGLACAEKISDIINHEGSSSIAGVLIEPAETSGRMIPPPPGYLNKVSEICRHNKIPLILDEVITGFGRLSHWFGAERYGINADMIVCSKGLTSGYESLAAIIVKEEIANAFSGDDERTFKHGSTLGGRPAAAAAALETIKIMEEENLLERSKITSKYIQDLLKEIKPLPIVGQIRGEGMLFGIDLVNKNNQILTDHNLIKKIRHELIENGLITSTYSLRSFPIIELAPPLIISRNEIERIIEIIYDTLKRY